MKDSLLTVVLLIWLVEKGVAVRWPSKKHITLSVRTSRFDTKPQESFIPLPKSTTDHGIEDYEKVQLEKTFIYPFDLYCFYGDPKFCLFFYKRYIIGIQVSYPKSDVASVDPKVYNYSNPDYIETYFYKIPAYSVRIYFRNPNVLTRDYNYTFPDQFDGLWTKLDGKLLRFDAESHSNSAIIKHGEFVMHSCTHKNGLAYVRRLSEAYPCQNGYMLFMLYEKGKQVGFGHFAPGRLSPGPGKVMFNDAGGPGLQESIPNPPLCYKEMQRYGFTAFNIYLIEDPWYIRCNKCLCHGI